MRCHHHRIEDEEGHRYWVFREGLYQDSGDTRLAPDGFGDQPPRHPRKRGRREELYLGHGFRIAPELPNSPCELDVTSILLRGGSHGEELVAAQARRCGLSAIACTDRNTLAGVVRADLAAKEVGIKFIVGARFDLEDGISAACLPDGPRRLWPALPPPDAGQVRRRERQMHPPPCRCRRSRRRPDLHRDSVRGCRKLPSLPQKGGGWRCTQCSAGWGSSHGVGN